MRPAFPGLNITSKTFKFMEGDVEISFPNGNIPRGYHYCRQEPWVFENKNKMNTRFADNIASSDQTVGVLFCKECGLRVKFKYSTEMPLVEIEQQIELAANCSWPGSYKNLFF